MVVNKGDESTGPHMVVNKGDESTGPHMVVNMAYDTPSLPAGHK
jgi:hypothetical protein